MSLSQEDLDQISARVATANRCSVGLKRGAKGEVIIEVEARAETTDQAAEDAKRVFQSLTTTFTNN